MNTVEQRESQHRWFKVDVYMRGDHVSSSVFWESSDIPRESGNDDGRKVRRRPVKTGEYFKFDLMGTNYVQVCTDPKNEKGWAEVGGTPDNIGRVIQC